MMIIELLILAGFVVWIIKDHRAVMVELKRMRETGTLAENGYQSGIIDR